jgi:hypothetical protein
MDTYKIIQNVKNRKEANDKIYTPNDVAIKMISLCDIKEGDKVLDCSKGGGVFYNNYPTNCIKDYCEIEENRDFFNYNDKVDWIIGNPPYSLWTKWINHTVNITDNFCYIFGAFNLTPSRLQIIYDKGFIATHFHICKVNWWFSPSFIIVFKKGNQEDNILTTTKGDFMCDICNKRCYRGRTYKKKNMV